MNSERKLVRDRFFVQVLFTQVQAREITEWEKKEHLERGIEQAYTKSTLMKVKDRYFVKV